MTGSAPELIYICFHKNEDGGVVQVNTGTDKDRVENLEKHEDQARFVRRGNSKSTDYPEAIENNENKTEINELMKRSLGMFYNSLSPYHKLIDLTNFFRQGLQRAGMENNLYVETKKAGSLITEKKDLETYSVPYKIFPKIEKHIQAMEEIDVGMGILPSSILLSVVATFDSNISQFCRNMLRHFPEKGSLGDKTITFREVLSFKNLEEAREQLIENEVDKLNRGSHIEQTNYLEKLSDTKIAGFFTKWKQHIEIFERRNLFAHSDGVVNSIYLKNLTSNDALPRDIKEGDKLNLNAKYLHKSVDSLRA